MEYNFDGDDAGTKITKYLPAVIDANPRLQYRQSINGRRRQMMLPIVSASLTTARAIRGLTMLEVAGLAGVTEDEVFHAENALEFVRPSVLHRIATVLNVDLDKLRVGP